ncbi:MAG: Maf family protein [Gammaproteobacteria bacterium]
MKTLILASSSPSRRAQLAELKQPFTIQSPDIDETRLPGEGPEALARRLAIEKAQKIAALNPDAIVIGSDQVGFCEGRFIEKPITHEKAIAQWEHQSGHIARFYTGLCVMGNGETQVSVVLTEIKFKTLTREAIISYLEKDTPYQCCAGIKIESHGMDLVEYIQSDDPDAIIGLPLIEVARMLKNVGIDVQKRTIRPH